MLGLRWVLLGMGLLVLACRQDCSEAARMGDFELLQGNYANAIRHYERALKIDSNCGVVKDKLEEAKRKVGSAP